jgi:hypothetical protein
MKTLLVGPAPVNVTPAASRAVEPSRNSVVTPVNRPTPPTVSEMVFVAPSKSSSHRCHSSGYRRWSRCR